MKVLGAFTISIWLILAEIALSNGEEDTSELSFWNRFVQETGSLPPPTPSISTFPPTTNVASVPSSEPFACNVDVAIDCETSTGGSCETITATPVQCADGEMEEISFTFVVSSCPESDNMQEGVATCSDDGTYAGGDILVECTDAEGTQMSVSPAIVEPDEEFSVTNLVGGALPDGLCCVAYNIANGDAVQTNCLDTSGDIPVDIGDRFGHFTVASCDGETCTEEMEFTYTITNIGTSDMDIASITQYTDSVPESLIGSLNETVLEPGQQVIVTDTVPIYACEPGQHNVDVEVDADSPNGLTCNAFDNFTVSVESSPGTSSPAPTTPAPSMPTPAPEPTVSAEPTTTIVTGVPGPTTLPEPTVSPGPTTPGVPTISTLPPTSFVGSEPTSEPLTCSVDVDIECETSNGDSCETIQVTSGQCKEGDMETISFLVSVSSCDESSNMQEGDASCSDDGTYNGGDILVECTDSDGDQLTVSPVVVSPDQKFTVEDDGSDSLPDKICCMLLNDDGSPLQTNCLDVSGDVPLNIGDKFGHLTVESCDGNSCTEEMEFTYTITNVGTSDMDITMLTEYVDSIPESLLELIEDTTLEAGEKVVVTNKLALDVCGPGQYNVDVEVDADSSDGITCNGFANFTVSVESSPVTSSPAPATGTPAPSMPTPAPEPTVSSAPTTSIVTGVPGPTIAPESTLSPAPTTSVVTGIPGPTTPAPSMPTTAPEPTSLDSVQPTTSIAVEPTISPAPFTPSPTMSLSTSPVAPQCEIDFEISCAGPDGSDCTALPPTIQQCEDRPYAMTMLLNGGDCSQSYSVQVFQPDKFSCTDVVPGGVPTTEGTEVFVVVFALSDPSIVYTYDYVPVGSTFLVNDNDEIFETDQNVTIYSSDKIGYDTMLQTINYHSSCSQDLFLKDRFGAVQLVEWINEEQGVVSSFANATFDVSVTVPIDITGSGLTLTSMFAVTNVGVFNFTDEVSGQTIDAGDSVEVSYDATLDLSTEQRYTILAEITGTTDAGTTCRGTAFYNFTAGVTLPDTFPSDAPALAPSDGTASKVGGQGRKRLRY